jgi:uncharacterized membrane protein
MSEQPGGQKASGTQPDLGKTSSGIQPNVAGLLCYVGWWVTGLIFLLIEKENKFVRFHAIQSIATFAVIFILAIIFGTILVISLPILGLVIGWILWVLGIVLWILLMYQAYQGKLYKLPIVGNFAAKQAKIDAK